MLITGVKFGKDTLKIYRDEGFIHIYNLKMEKHESDVRIWGVPLMLRDRYIVDISDIPAVIIGELCEYLEKKYKNVSIDFNWESKKMEICFIFDVTKHKPRRWLSDNDLIVVI